MPDLLNLLAAVLAGGTVVLVLAPLIFRETRRARAIDRRLGTVREQALQAGAPSLDRLDRTTGNPFQSLGVAVLRMGSILVPVGAAEREKLARILRQGGFLQPEALSYFLSAKLASAVAFGAGAGLMANNSAMLSEYGFLVAMAALAGLVVGGIVPEYGLRTLVSQRARRITAVLPDALDMLVVCLEAGLTVERAIMTVSEELRPIERGLSGEFRQIEADLRLSADRRAALSEYYRRTEIDGLRDLAMALIQSERYGTPLSQSMRAIAADERLQKAARITAQAERLPVLMTLPMLLLVMPGTFLLVAGPAFLTATRAFSTIGAGG